MPAGVGEPRSEFTMRIGDDGLVPNGSGAISGRSTSSNVCVRALERHRPREPTEQLGALGVAQDVPGLVELGGREPLRGRRAQREHGEPLPVELEGRVGAA